MHSAKDRIERAQRWGLDQVNEKSVYTVAEVAYVTGLSRQTVTRMFQDEKGVIIIPRPEELNKRGYRSIRIPRAVYERVIRKVTV